MSSFAGMNADFATNLPANLPLRRRVSSFAKLIFRLATWVAVLLLAVLLVQISLGAWNWLDWQFLTSFPSRFAEKAGIKAALAGTLWLISLTALIAVPIGIGAAIYLEE